MTETTIQAIYEGGVFRPTEPVALKEGERVRLNVVSPVQPDPKSVLGFRSQFSPEQRDLLRRIADAKTDGERASAFQESLLLFPDEPDDDYDLMAHLELNRAMSGERPLDPESRLVSTP